MSQETKEYIKLALTPEEVGNALPVNFLGDSEETDVSAGFTDKTLTIPSTDDQVIKFDISYDGESELLADIIEKPANVSDDEAVEMLRGFFSNSEEEDDEDEGEYEDEE